MGKQQAKANAEKLRDDRLELRLGGAEKQAFKEAADLAGVPLSSWIRERLRKAARDELTGFGRPVPFLGGRPSSGKGA